MLIGRWREIESLYHAARERDPGERARFLQEACGSDESLRDEVESLLANEDPASSFLESARAEALEALAGEPVAASKEWART